MYLYVKERDNFSDVPVALLAQFGQPRLVMLLPLDGSKILANADLATVKQSLSRHGYYLQMPPPVENLLQQHWSVVNVGR